MSPKIFGILLVRNEVDIIAVNILYHLFMGLDRFLIVDNGSSDGTDRVLRQMASDKRVRWTRDDSPYHQAAITTELAREAFRNGADWVVPIDADEFWYTPCGNLRSVLKASTAGALRVPLVNFIQRRAQVRSSTDALRFMTRRVATPIGPPERVAELVESRQIAFVEMMYPPKWISRSAAEIGIAAGNHSVSGVSGPFEDTDQLVILHAPLRSRAVLDAKAEQGRRVEEAGYKPGDAWHVRRFHKLQEEDALDREWVANSYADDALDVYGVRHSVVFDPRLRDALRPWIRTPLRERFLSLWNRGGRSSRASQGMSDRT